MRRSASPANGRRRWRAGKLLERPQVYTLDNRPVTSRFRALQLNLVFVYFRMTQAFIGWRRSADRTCLHLNSQEAGNFTGNFAF